ncbi:gasdermin-E-like [Ptychodera flava]|uniref:gasdermin-E-like n=1 Tax=Ptychodera flava TaxID=63121 RepID=UPI00396A6E02
MFAAVAKKLSKSLGEDTLLPVPSLDQAKDCSSFHVVVKKKRRWFWRSPKYTPSPFTIQQLLTDPDNPLDVPVSKEDLTDFDDSMSFDAKGKIGGNVLSEVELEVSGEDNVQVTSKLGTIVKEKVNIPLLQDALLNRSLNLSHPFMTEVHRNRRNVLCVVVSVLSPTKDSLLVTHVTHNGTEDADMTIVKRLGGEEDVTIDDEKVRTLRVPANTPVAYHVCELQVSRDGKIKLLILGEGDGGFDLDLPQGDVPDGSEVDNPFVALPSNPSLYEMFKPITGLEFVEFSERYWLSHWLHSLLAYPYVIGELEQIIGLAHSNVNEKTKVEQDLSFVVRRLDGKVSQWNNFLKKVKFIFTEEKVIFPEEDSDGFLRAIHCVLAAMLELSDDQCHALHQWHGDNYKLAFHLVKETVDKGFCPTLDDPHVRQLFSGPPSPARNFTNSLGFQAVKSPTGEEKLQTRDLSFSELQGALRVLYAVWGSE